MRSRKRGFQALQVIQVRRHHLGVGLREFTAFIAIGFSGERADAVRAGRIIENGADQAAALCTGRTDHSNKWLLGCHMNLL